MYIPNKRTIIIAVIVILVSAIILMGGQLYSSSKELQAANSLLIVYQQNQKVLNFTKLFVEKVLMATKEVSFDDRLRLENAVRDLGNKAIQDQWQKFTESKTEVQAQEEVKNLLYVLVNRI